MAADERGRGLLGLELAGTGRTHHPEAQEVLWGPRPEGTRPAGLGDLLWRPRRLYPPELVGGASPLVERRRRPGGLARGTRHLAVPLGAPPERAVTGGGIALAVTVDSFGNLITNITKAMLEGVPRNDSVTICCEEHETQGIFATYSDQPTMTFMAHVGSTGRLELAVVDENASAMLGVRVGAPVRVCW